MAKTKQKAQKKTPPKKAVPQKKAPAKKQAAKKAAPAKPALSKKQLEDSKGLAYTLYVENGWEGRQISETLGISENTISRWKLENDWEQKREELRLGPEHEINRLRGMINRLLDDCEKREAPNNYPDSKESDQISKWSAAIRSLRKEHLTIVHKTQAGKEFINNTQELFGHDAAKQAVEWWHSYIMKSA